MVFPTRYRRRKPPEDHDEENQPPTTFSGVEQWESVRTVLRPLFIHEKERRRLAVGAHLTFLFEKRARVWYQIEEMIRSERMTDAAAIQHEIDTYNELIPARGEISATLLIEFAEATGARRGAAAAGRNREASVAEAWRQESSARIR